MNYHNITSDDMLNGSGLRVVLWVAGCDHKCKGCQNPITWNENGGIKFDNKAKLELFEKLSPSYISGITLSGGDPLFKKNRSEVTALCKEIKEQFPHKNIWLYTGYNWEDIIFEEVIQYIDVIVEGKFVKELADVKYHWCGSTNQRVINVKETIKKGEVVLWK